MRRNRRDDEERRPRDMWGATSREKAKPTIGSSSRKLFFGPVVRECTLPDGGVGRVDHLRSRLGTLELVVLSTDARSSFLSTATLDPRGADPLCSIADAGNNFSPSGFYSTSNPRGESQFTHFTSIIFPDVWENSIGSRGTLSFIMYLRFWATVLQVHRQCISPGIGREHSPSRHRRVLVFLFARFAGGHGALTLKLKTVS